MSLIYVSSPDAQLKQGWRIKSVRKKWGRKQKNLTKEGAGHQPGNESSLNILQDRTSFSSKESQHFNKVEQGQKDGDWETCLDQTDLPDQLGPRGLLMETAACLKCESLDFSAAKRLSVDLLPKRSTVKHSCLP